MTTVIPLKHLARINERALPATTDPDRKIRYVDIGSVGRGELVRRPERMRFADAPSRARRLVRDGDTIVSTVRTYLRAVWPIPGDGDDLVVSTGFAVLTPTEVDPRYFSWWVLSDTFIEEVVARSVGVSYPAINVSELGDLGVRVPALAEQRAIADYLDIETGRIDALISKKRRMIELLKQRWRAEVMSTVYGDDSVRWGAIRYVVDLLPGYAFPSSSFVDEGVRLLRGANIAPGRLSWDTNVVYLSPEDRPQLSEYELAEGDLVLGMDRPVIGAGMRVALVTASDLPCLLVQRVARIRATTRADAEYIRVLIESDAFVAYFSPITTGVSVPHISADQILSFRAPLPSYDVQHALATRLHRERTRLTAMSNRLTAQIVLLAERRQALITAAVTGELHVPGVAA